MAKGAVKFAVVFPQEDEGRWLPPSGPSSALSVVQNDSDLGIVDILLVVPVETGIDDLG